MTGTYFEDRQQGSEQSATWTSGTNTYDFNAVIINFLPPPAGYMKTGSICVYDSPPNIRWTVCRSQNSQLAQSFSALPIATVMGAGLISNVQAQPNDIITLIATTGSGFSRGLPPPPPSFDYVNLFWTPINTLGTVHAVWIGSVDAVGSIETVGPNTTPDGIIRFNNQAPQLFSGEAFLGVPMSVSEVSSTYPLPVTNKPGVEIVTFQNFASVACGAGVTSVVPAPAAGFYNLIEHLNLFGGPATAAGGCAFEIGGVFFGGVAVPNGGQVNYDSGGILVPAFASTSPLAVTVDNATGAAVNASVAYTTLPVPGVQD
jgi:hypothetical protein